MAPWISTQTVLAEPTSGTAQMPTNTYVGRWSRLVTREFVEWLAVPPGGRWLDVGCGTGALIHAALAHATPSEVLGIDPSAAYVASARAQMEDSRARFDLGDAQALQAPAATFDVLVSGLVLNFVAQSDRAVAEMARVARPGEPLQPTFGTTPKACG